jgi:molybdate transport system substrate-binding protein
VFASADERNVAILRGTELVRAPVMFAKNQPVLVVPAANPAGLATFADLPKAPHVVLGASEVPIGAYADAILIAAEKRFGKAFRDQVGAHIRSRELNARQVLTNVLGEADGTFRRKRAASPTCRKISLCFRISPPCRTLPSPSPVEASVRRVEPAC